MSRILFRACLTALALPASAWGAGGTMIVASKDQPVPVTAGWPRGVGDIVNDPARTTGWNSWFSEWPNDVNQYAMEIESAEDLNRLIGKLAAAESEIRQIRLSHLKEPQSLGWVTRLPKGNGTPVIFSIGNQSRIDQWYKQVRKPFGVMEFLAAPVAVPPTLTLFVQNPKIDLSQLTIPPGITVTEGYVPTLFHRMNTKREKQREEEAAKQPAAPPMDLDPASQEAADEIREFLEETR